MVPPSPSPRNDNKDVTIRRARVGSIDIYEVKDSELDILEKGGAAQTQLNFAVFLATLAFSSMASLFTATFESIIIEIAFVVVAVVGALGSLYLFVQWRHSKTSVKSLVNNIRNRMDDPPFEKPAEASYPPAPDNDPSPPPS